VYGYQQSGSATQTVKSYRTGLSYGQPLSTKLSASLSIAYNVLTTTDSATAANSNRQNQFQASANLGYTVSPRLSLSLSYTYLDLLSTLINSSYTRDQIYLGGTYTFQ
jgi:predicted porin